SFELRFVRQNSGRLLGSIPVVVNNVYHYPVQAVDADGDPITFRLLSAPAGATIAATTGLISWHTDRPGSYPFLVEVSRHRGCAPTPALPVRGGGAPPPPPADDHAPGPGDRRLPSRLQLHRPRPRPGQRPAVVLPDGPPGQHDDRHDHRRHHLDPRRGPA